MQRYVSEVEVIAEVAAIALETTRMTLSVIPPAILLRRDGGSEVGRVTQGQG
jgi:hypothetical protein